MSDLAPFVAAVLRDKVVADLEQENAELRRNKQRIQIKSTSSNTVYAEGFLQDATATTGPILDIALTTLNPLPVENFRGYNDLLVLMGGICKGALRQRVFPIQMNQHGDLLLPVRADGQASVLLEICGWPRQDWEEAMAAPGFRANDPQVVEDFVLRNMNENRFPGATLKFPFVLIAVKNEGNAIQDLPEPARSRILQEIENATREDSD